MYVSSLVETIMKHVLYADMGIDNAKNKITSVFQVLVFGESIKISEEDFAR